MNDYTIPKKNKPSGGRTPGGNALTSGGGGFQFDENSFINFGRGLTNKIIKGEKYKGLQGKNPGLFNSIKENFGQGIDASLFDKNPGLYGKGTAVKRDPIVKPKSEQGSLDAYNALRDLEIARLKNQSSVNNMLMGLMPSLLSANNGAVNKYSSMLNEGLTELDPAINSRIDRGVQGYIGNASKNLKDLYTGIADGFVNDVAQGGIGGFGVGEGFKDQVTEPLSRELGNVVNNAEVYRGQLTDNVLSNQRQGLGTIASTAPALNQILQGFQLPTNQVNPAAINPTGNFDPNLIANMLQFTNTFQASRDDKKLEPWLLQFQAELQKELAKSQQGNGFGDIAGTIAGTAIGAIGGPAGAAIGGKIGSNIANKYF